MERIGNMKAIKKPIEVECFRYHDKVDSCPDWIVSALKEKTIYQNLLDDKVYIKTLEGDMLVSPGDIVIKGVEGELYPCKPDIFVKTYTVIEEDINE